MKLFHLSIVCAAAAGFAFFSPSTHAADAALSAADLAARLSSALENGNSYIRVRLECGSPKETLQLQIKQRRTKNSTEIVYQVLWPKERKGEAVLLKKSGNRAATGVLFTLPNTTRTLDAGDMKEALFGSDLSYEDVVDNFFAWDQQAFVGREEVDGVPCEILESKPGKNGRSLYGSVRSWIDVRRFVPLRVEKYSSGGQTVRRIDTTRVVSDEGRQIPANLSIRVVGKNSVTALDGSKIKHGVTFADSDFTAAGLRELTTPREQPE